MIAIRIPNSKYEIKKIWVYIMHDKKEYFLAISIIVAVKYISRVSF